MLEYGDAVRFKEFDIVSTIFGKRNGRKITTEKEPAVARSNVLE